MMGFPNLQVWRWAVVALAMAGLSACAQSPYGRLAQGLWDTVSPGSADPLSAVVLNPNYRYLWVQANESAPALLVLGEVDRGQGGDTLVWFSARKEVLKTRDGRLAGTVGLPHDWRSVNWTPHAPAWPDAPGKAVVFQRQHDEPVRYRYGLRAQVKLQALPPGLPSEVQARLPQALPTAVAAQWQWYSESAEGWPQAWYARARTGQGDRTVYGFQCLTQKDCLQWMEWPVVQP